VNILYISVIEEHAGWGAEWFVDRALKSLGHPTHTVDFRKHRHRLTDVLADAPPYDALLLQRGDRFPVETVAALHGPRLFWASELLSRCRDQDDLIRSGLFDHVFFHSQACVEQAVAAAWIPRQRASVMLNGFDPEVHRPLPDVQPVIDVLFAGSLTARRQGWLDRLAAYVDLTVAQAYGEDLVQLVARSRIVLNLHAEAWLDTETRVFETLGCGTLLLTERLSAENPFVAGEHLVEFATFDDLRRKAAHYLARDGERQRIAQAGQRATLAGHTYRQRAGQIVDAIERCRAAGPPALVAAP
jgi:hypothetical protein